MLCAKNFREMAFEKIRGKWGLLALVALINYAIGLACGLTAYLSGVILLFIEGAFLLSWAIITLKVARADNFKVEDIFCGFKNYIPSLVLYIIISVFTFLWTLLFIVPGIIKSYSYSMSYFILADNPGMSANDARKMSMKIMYGNKWRLFCLDFSYIGWSLLSILTLGILLLWVVPYMQVAHAEFYQDLILKRTVSDKPETVIPDDNFSV